MTSCARSSGRLEESYTLIVLFTVLILATFIGGVDYLLAEAAKRTIYNNGAH
jgi:hypothetical protein